MFPAHRGWPGCAQPAHRLGCHASVMRPPGATTTEDVTRVLVVDDEPNITELVSLGLRYEGFDVSSAHDGRGALRAVREFTPELMILDVTMPDIDGLEVVRRMRAEHIWTPVIFLTARDAIEDKVAGLTVGGDDYLTKPFSLDELIARVRAIVRRNDLGPPPPPLAGVRARRLAPARRPVRRPPPPRARPRRPRRVLWGAPRQITLTPTE